MFIASSVLRLFVSESTDEVPGPGVLGDAVLRDESAVSRGRSVLNSLPLHAATPRTMTIRPNASKRRRSPTRRGRTKRLLAPIFSIRHVTEPCDDLAVAVGLLHGDVRHVAIGSGPVPVLFARLDIDHIAGADLLDVTRT